MVNNLNIKNESTKRLLNTNIDTVDIRILHTLAERGSLTGVHEALGLSQPAISQRLKRLEERLGVALIEPQGRGVRLTAAGKIMASHGTKAVAEFAAAFEKITALKDDRGGSLRMVAFPSASATIVPEIMRALRKQAPGVTLQYREAEPPAALEMLREGNADCALVFNYRDNTELPAGVVYTELWREELCLVVDSADPRAQNIHGLCLNSFRDEDWIAGCEKCRGNLLALAAEYDFQPHIVQETDNIPAMVAMVAAGGAVALVPALALAGMRGLPAGATACKIEPPAYRSIGFAALRTSQPSPAVRLAVDLLAEVDGSKFDLQKI